MPESRADRRRDTRFPLGLPVGVRLGDGARPLMVELLDVSAHGARFYAAGAEVHVAERAMFGFVVPDRPSCRAEGRVLRADRSGQFVLALDETNDAFVGFIRLLEAES